MPLSSVLPFFFALLRYVNSETKMILVWGEPASSDDSIVNSTLSWNECIRSCYVSQSCIMAWQSDNACHMYNYDFISTVAQTRAEHGSIVAWKVDAPAGQCPVGTNAPIFNKPNATGTLFVDEDPSYFPMYIHYSIYSVNGTWKVSFSANVSCRTIFTDIINHSDGTGLCISALYTENDESFDYNSSVILCKNETGYLAGLVYPEDFAWSRSRASLLQPKMVTPDVYARIDGIRTPACRSTPSTALCMSPKGFTFTGPPPPHFNNYNWVTNASAMATPDDNCLVMVIKGNNTPQVDVQSCSFGWAKLLIPRMFFCSTEAWKLEIAYYN